MNWNWSFRLVRLFRTDVRIHWSLLAFAIYYVMRGAERGGGALFIGLFVLLPYALLLVSVVMHEFGHVFAARHYGLAVHHIVLTPIGGIAVTGGSFSPRSEFVIAACEPLVNLVLATSGTGVYFALGGQFFLDMLLPLTQRGFTSLWADGQIGLLLLYDFVQTQMLLFLFNVLMVAYPMDGGRMVFSVLWKRKGYRRGLVISCKVAKVVAVGMGVVGLVTLSPMLIVIAVFVYLQATATQRNAPLMAEPQTGYLGALHKQRAQRDAEPGWMESWKRSREARQTTKALEKAEREGIHTLTSDERELLRKRRQRMN